MRQEEGRYKFRSTPAGRLPTIADVVATVAGGLRGTSMSGFANLLSPSIWRPLRARGAWPPIALFRADQAIGCLMSGTPDLPASLTGAKRAFAERGRYL